jgi:hypothetical protein
MTEETGHGAKDAGSAPMDAETAEAIVAFFGGDIDEFDEINKELEKQTPRGLAVLGAALIDSRLKQMIKRRMFVQDRITDQLIGADDDSGGRIEFYDVCRLAYCLGLVGQSGLSDLDNIGSIRNRFSHRKGVRQFSDPRIIDLCKNLKSPERWHAHVGRTPEIIPKTKKYDDPKEYEKALNLYLENRFRLSVFSLYIMPFASVHEQLIEWKARTNEKPIFW